MLAIFVAFESSVIYTRAVFLILEVLKECILDLLLETVYILSRFQVRECRSLLISGPR